MMTNDKLKLGTKNAMISNRYYDIEVGKKGKRIWFKVDGKIILDAIDDGKLRGYLTDVLSTEPLDDTCMLRDKPGVLITPHIGSRTLETIQRQGRMAVNNLISLVC